MKKTLKIEQKYNNSVLNICLDTLRLKKQALVFVNSKPSAESEAERIAVKIKPEQLGKEESEALEALSQKILGTLEKSTKQCQRLALCVRSGVAFHHAGLHSEQRELVEDNFRNGTIKIICATPTIAYGMNLPAFRVIVRDLKRFSAPRGMSWIPVLEFLQFCGRAGRPDFNEDYGEAICLAETDSEKDNVFENYIRGEPEEILSKLAVEPILRSYVLSLISIEYTNTRKALMDFFSKTFYAHQYEDMEKLEEIIDKILGYLEGWEFIAIDKAKDKDRIESTLLGKRVSELYLDPYTADYLITCMKRAGSKLLKDFSFLQMISYTLELRPLLNVRVSEYEKIEDKIAEFSSSLLSIEPSMFEPEYEDYLKSIKTALFFYDWINEKDDEELLEAYNIRPGEVRAKLSLADWLLFSAEELAKLTKMHGMIKEIEKVRIRLKHGAKEELLSLLRLTGIGRIRARKLYNNKLRTLEELKKADLTMMSQLIGKQVALSVKKQLGEDLREETVQVKKTKRRGQLSLEKYEK
ncbi:MAG: helicase-related protein [archaeon]